MSPLIDRVRTRVLPALLTAAGVALLASGLLTYATPVVAESQPSPTPIPRATPVPSATPRITLPPLASPSTGPSGSPAADRVATRIRIAALDIDLPVITGSAGYPACDVAMYIRELGQPGQGWSTYLYAHARRGMFLPILEASRIQNGKKMLGMVVEVWTSDDRRFLYEISEVRRHQTDLEDAIAADHEQLWLQTSEGPRGTVPKTQIVAELLSEDAAPHEDAHPTPEPVACS